MRIESLRLSIAHLLLQSSQQQVEWLMKPQRFMNVLPPSYLRDGPTNMLLFWAGFIIVSHFHYYVQPSDVYGALVLFMDVLVGPLHQLKLTLSKRSKT